jgi:cytoskeletal protein CcmA (bactofilin family)
MSDPSGQLSGLPVGDSRLKQSREFLDLLPDTSQYFEAWLEDLKPKLEPKATHPQPSQLTVAQEPAPGEFRFEGTLRLNGYAAGFLHSVTGTLIIGESGEVEADIIVAAAIIDGFLRGNIHATERVELGSKARVFGNIESPALSIQPGAVFEGECHFLPLYKVAGEDKGQMRSGSPMFSLLSNQDSPGVNNEACEEEAKALAVATGR